MKNLSRYIKNIKYQHSTKIANWLVELSTYKAKRILKESEPIGVLVDNTVLSHATTHKTTWIHTGLKPWGDHNVKTGYLARTPVYSSKAKTREYDDISYLPSLFSLQRAGLLNFYSSSELYNERFYQPVGRFQGCGYLDSNFFENRPLKIIDQNTFPCLGPSWMELPSSQEQLIQRLKKMEIEDPLYASLVKVLGRKNSQDAWHIRTAEKYGLYCFLTMDFKLIKTLEAQRKSPRIISLKTSIMTPAMLGKKLRLYPMPPKIFSYTNVTPAHSNVADIEKK